MKEGWEEIPLGDVLTLNYGKPLPRDERNPDGSYPVLGANGIKSYSEKFYYETPSLIVGRKGSAGEINRVETPFWPLDVTYFTTHDEDRIDFDFLEYLLFSLELPKMAKGVKPGINRNEVYDLSITLPPLEEQRRIVATLDQAFEGLDRARANTETNLESAKELFEVVLNEAVLGNSTESTHKTVTESIRELTREQKNREGEKKFRKPRFVTINDKDVIPAHWTWASTEQLCTHIVDCLHTTPKWTHEGEICLRTTNFRPGELNLTKVRYVSSETYQTRISRLEPKPGDVLYSREGGILGIACMHPPDLKACLGQRMMQFRLRNEYILPEYFCSVLNSALILGEVRHFTGGAASPHLNIGDIRQFPIPVPPKPEQETIVATIEFYTKKFKTLNTSNASQQNDCNDLRRSLLAKAFAGELT
ncbi:restriction endonuclease subunit S [Hellea balneolensis]|uniref:restriction endonuclease subunit S n=1 Tax=Hellea balneolensis TaxID=287478 RepID=UPI000410A15D|nr:restriction endonuclease subunit S [Hellea balneolensis]